MVHALWLITQQQLARPSALACVHQRSGALHDCFALQCNAITSTTCAVSVSIQQTMGRLVHAHAQMCMLRSALHSG